MKGRIHSFQSLGAVDGPGLRYVVFLQGCTLRCAYCHNPDTWNAAGGEEYEADDIVRKILRYKSYFGKDGGVTVSGGEPLLQWQFVAELFQKLHAEGIRTALDTAGIGDLQGAREVLKHTDLVLCDLKFSRAEDYQRWCKGNMSQVADFLQLTEQMSVPLWIRHVVVPGLNDGEADILRTASITGQYGNLKKLELLPFRKLCETKYQTLGIEFPLHEYPECSDSEIQRLYRLLESDTAKRS